MQRKTPVLALGLILSWTVTVAGQQSADETAAQLASAKESFTPISADMIDAARSEAQAATAALDQFLTAGGSAENTRRWKDYLQWGPMTIELQKSSTEAGLRPIQVSAARFFQHEEGLHLPQFVRVRDGLMEYLTLLSLSRRDNLEQLHQRQLENLETHLQGLQEDPHSATAPQQIASVLGWLEQANQAPALVEHLQDKLWHDNLRLRVSHRLAEAGMSEQLVETVSVNDNILGTSLTGTAVTSANIGLQFVPDETAAKMRISLAGDAQSNNVGFNRGVTIFSQGYTSLNGTKELSVDADGIHDQAAEAECATNSNISDIQARSCLIQRIAWKRATRMKSAAELEASSHAAYRLQQQMDERAEEILQDARAAFEDRFRKPLLRRGEFPEVFSFSTSESFLNLRFRQRNRSQAAAATPVPDLKQDQDLALRVHESFVPNLSRALIGGVTLTDKQLEKMLTDMKMEVPPELKTGDKPPWSITFSPTNPVSVSFRDDNIRLAIRGRRFVQGGNLAENIELAADYALQRTERGSKMVRQGDVQANFLGRRGRLRPEEVAIRAVMRAKFEALFQEEFENEGLKLPGNWEKAGPLVLDDMSSNNGWLVLGWLLPDDRLDQVATQPTDGSAAE